MTVRAPESVLRVFAPAPLNDWWAAYRSLYETVARIGERHTSTPDTALYAVLDDLGDAVPTPAVPVGLDVELESEG